MEQKFFDAKTGKETAKKDSTGGLEARIKQLEAKMRGLMGIPEPTPTPAPKSPTRQKKVLDKKLNPDTGEMAGPGEPTVRYDGKKKKRKTDDRGGKKDESGEKKRQEPYQYQDKIKEEFTQRDQESGDRKTLIDELAVMLANRGQGGRSYDGSVGSGPSYHYDATCYDGAVAGGPGIGGPNPLGVPVGGMAQRTVGPHGHLPGVAGYTEASEIGTAHEASTDPHLHK